MNHLANFDLIILFFILGAVASWIKSDLEIPEPASKFLSIFLLLSLGLKGGHEVVSAQSLNGFLPTLGIGLFSCLVIPAILFYFLKSRLGPANSAALAASYGSVSAVTFVTAQSFLENEGVAFSGYMVAIMAIMEIPAIIVGGFLYKKFSQDSTKSLFETTTSLLKSKSVVLLIGGFLIGLSLNEISWAGISPVIQTNFKGALAFFLLDLGIVAQKQLRQALDFKFTGVIVSFFFPIFFGLSALFVASALSLSVGDQILIATLVGSASYIAAPAAIRALAPSANPGLYLGLPLALTFPMNLLFGIPFYLEVARWLSRSV